MMVHKHVSFDIKAEHYTIVGECLLAALKVIARIVPEKAGNIPDVPKCSQPFPGTKTFVNIYLPGLLRTYCDSFRNLAVPRIFLDLTGYTIGL